MSGEILGYACLNSDTNVVLKSDPFTSLTTREEAEAAFPLSPEHDHIEVVEVRSLEQ